MGMFVRGALNVDDDNIVSFPGTNAPTSADDPRPKGGGTPPTPPDYISVGDAARRLSALPWDTVVEISTGQTPANWHEPRVTAQWVRVAKHMVSGGEFKELTNRTEGKQADTFANPDGSPINFQVITAIPRPQRDTG